MPIIGSISGSFGYGRSPQTAPPPGFTIYPAIGNLRNWSFSSNGTCTFDGNTTSRASGNVFVITPTTTFVCNVKIWGGGGGGANLVPAPGANPVAGSGGATYGQVLFKVGQPYTIFSGGAGNVILNKTYYAAQVGSGGGGSASGILEGNLYANTSAVLSEIAIAGGGGGAVNSLNYDPIQSTAGGGVSNSQVPPVGPTIRMVGLPSSVGSGAGDPFPVSYAALSVAYTGGYPLSLSYGGGGGGHVGGGGSNGGSGYTITSDLELSTTAGVYGLPPLYDDTLRSNAGDSDSPGRVVLFLDEYRPTTIVATGGTITDVPIPGQTLAYRYHTFSSNGKFTVTSASTVDKIDVIAVGGGGGGDLDGAGGGGGGVALRNGLSIGVGAYNVTVGQGGLPATQSALANVSVVGLGGVYGGYRGTDSAFFTNSLSTRFMPDNYWRLINSFGSRIIYVSTSGSDTITSGSFANPYASIEYTLASVSDITEMIVIVILSGTYSPVILPNLAQTPINDNGRPRIFICAPGKVIINYTPVQATGSQRDSPVAILAHRLSAVYGATFVRNMFETTNNRELAFFNDLAQVGAWPARGSFYNCVFKEALGKWALVYRNNAADTANFTVENCTFVTKDAGQALISPPQASLTLFKNCAFNKTATTDSVLDNCVTNATISAKYVITGVTDKGVFAGEYSWGAEITTPTSTAKSIVYVGIGGGGGTTGTHIISPNAIGGSGGGKYGNYVNTAVSLQHNGIINSDYSGYGYRGGQTSSGFHSGGGGAMFPPLLTIDTNSAGGLGIEWPAGSSTYYGTGGDATDVFDVTAGLTHIGRGATGGSGTAGGNGQVAVRYIVQGEYTPSTFTANVNILAYGGQAVRQVGNYREHIFTSSGTFRLGNLPPDSKLDIVLVGGGGGGRGGSGTGSGASSYGGASGGYVGYHSISTSTLSQFGDYAIIIGAGGARGYTYNLDSFVVYTGANPSGGGTSSILGSNVSLTAQGGATSSNTPSGVTIDSGLYVTNPVFYGGNGANMNGGAGGAPGGGSSFYAGSPTGFGGGGLPGTGGGGGSGPGLVSNRNYTSYSYGGLGGSGVVVIRYPYTP